jgi:oxygen-independent coproporphyrinogen-3 oxidase
MTIGLYLHFPFCIQKCRYCDFPSCAGKEDLMDPYLEALLKEIESYRDFKTKHKVSSIFMGGGTPTLFSGASLVRVLNKCRESFTVEEDAEISIECNPGTADYDKFKILADGGFNRLSVGLQAWQNHHLELLGRIHRLQEFVDTIDWAEAAGFHNINADVIFGIPGQTLDEWLETLERTAAAGITHLSAYSLKIEEDTIFYRWKQSGRIREMDDEDERKLYHEGIKLLESLGLMQYEISNFAVRGYESRHNLTYWRNGDYIGCGSGAHSHMHNLRWSNVKAVERYIDSVNLGKSVLDFKEEIDNETEIFETLMLGFRLKEGINKKVFKEKYGFSLSDKYGEGIKELKSKGLITEDEAAFRPTSLGFDFENAIALTFLK